MTAESACAGKTAERAAEGPVWVFSVDGRVPVLPGVQVRLAVWNPVPACLDFDVALLHARAMVGEGSLIALTVQKPRAFC